MHVVTYLARASSWPTVSLASHLVLQLLQILDQELFHVEWPPQCILQVVCSIRVGGCERQLLRWFVLSLLPLFIHLPFQLPKLLTSGPTSDLEATDLHGLPNQLPPLIGISPGSNSCNKSLITRMVVVLLWPSPSRYSLSCVAWVRESQTRYQWENYSPFWFPESSNRHPDRWVLGQGIWRVSWCFLMTRTLPNQGRNEGICPRYSIAFLSGSWACLCF